MTKIQAMQQQTKQELMEAGFPDCPGIYGIVVNGHVVYVGQSKDIARRLAEHKINILILTSKSEPKYRLLHAIHDQRQYNQRISFKVIQTLDNPTKDQINAMERFWIDQYNPVLNTVRYNKPRKDLNQYSLEQFAEDIGLHPDGFVF